MKSLLLIPFLVLCTLTPKANPIAPPPAICELVIHQNGFSLELALELWGISDLDNMRLTSSHGQAFFNQGIVVSGELLVVTENDLQSYLFVDPAGDDLSIEENYNGSWYVLDVIYFGDYQNSWVSPLWEGESVIQQEFNYWGEPFYWTVKNKPPSPGSSAYHTDARGTFSGYVLDKFSNAVPGAWIKYCHEADPLLEPIYSDSTGYFFCDNMFSREYDVEIIISEEIFWTDHIVVELDSNNYYEFIIDSIAVATHEHEKLQEFDIRNHPNPFTNNTTFDLNVPESYRWNEAQITIMDMNGKIVDRIEYHNSGDETGQKINWHAPSDLKPGIYIYTLEIDNNRIASNKMILN